MMDELIDRIEEQQATINELNDSVTGLKVELEYTIEVFWKNRTEQTEEWLRLNFPREIRKIISKEGDGSEI